MKTLEELCGQSLEETKQHNASISKILSSLKSYQNFPKEGVLFWYVKTYISIAC